MTGSRGAPFGNAPTSCSNPLADHAAPEMAFAVVVLVIFGGIELLQRRLALRQHRPRRIGLSVAVFLALGDEPVKLLAAFQRFHFLANDARQLVELGMTPPPDRSASAANRFQRAQRMDRPCIFQRDDLAHDYSPSSLLTANAMFTNETLPALALRLWRRRWLFSPSRL